MALSRQKIHFPKPVTAFQFAAFGAPPVPVDEVDARVTEAYRRGQSEADDFHRQQLHEQRIETVEYQERVLARVEQQVEALLSTTQARVPELVFALVARVLDGVSLDAEQLRALILATIAELHQRDGEHLEVMLTPTDLEKLNDLRASGDGELSRLTFIADERLGSGDVQVRSRFGLLDARLETKWAKVKREVLGE